MGNPVDAMRSDGPEFRLLAITPPTGMVDPAVVEAWAGARSVGLAVLLREPGTKPDDLVNDGHRLAPLRRACADAGVPCLLSVDAPAVATLESAVHAAGVFVSASRNGSGR